MAVGDLTTFTLCGTSGAVFSPCRHYRYVLWGWWDKDKPYLMVIGLNPSTADETKDDPTIRRCKRFASDWGYGGLCMVNLFAIRATKPNDMLIHPSPIGENNDKWLERLSDKAGMVLAAWGNHGSHMGRNWDVRRLIERTNQMKCLGTTKSAQPRHPLYVKADITPILF